VGSRAALHLLLPPNDQLRRVPQFAVGDEVVIVSPGVEKGEKGTVIQVIGHASDFVYRYNILFADGTSKRYFSFEITSVLSHSA
jgi:hypothetical protein